MGCCGDECNLLNFLLTHQQEKDFYSIQCGCFHPVTLVGVRFFFAVYCLFFLTFDLGIDITESNSARWFKYFTSWAYIVCTLYFLFSFFLTFMEVCQICRKNLHGKNRKTRKNDPHSVEMKIPVEGRYSIREHDHGYDNNTRHGRRAAPERNDRNSNNSSNNNNNDNSEAEEEPLSVQFKIMWALYNIAVTISTTVTIGYWTIIHDHSEILDASLKTYLLVDRHGIVFLFMLCDFLLNRIPFRALHFIYPLGLGLLYLAFHLANWEITGESIYNDTLDWDEHPGHSLAYFTGFLIGIILVHMILFTIHRCKFCK